MIKRSDHLPRIKYGFASVSPLHFPAVNIVRLPAPLHDRRSGRRQQYHWSQQQLECEDIQNSKGLQRRGDGVRCGCIGAPPELKGDSTAVFQGTDGLPATRWWSTAGGTELAKTLEDQGPIIYGS